MYTFGGLGTAKLNAAYLTIRLTILTAPTFTFSLLFLHVGTIIYNTDCNVDFRSYDFQCHRLLSTRQQFYC
jgi:hypothetical protein